MTPDDPPKPAEPPQEPAIGSLIASAAALAIRLLRAELGLARTEIALGLRGMMAGVVLVAVAVIAALVAFGQLADALAAGLRALGLAPGWAHLATAAIWLLAAGGCVLLALRLLDPARLVPKRALDNLQRDLDAVQGRADDGPAP